MSEAKKVRSEGWEVGMPSRTWSLLRSVAYLTAAVFVLATLLQLVDQLNLVHQPPSVPDSANLVDRVTAQIPYRQAEWPIVAIGGLLLAFGFLMLIGLGLALAARIARSDDRRLVLLGTLVATGTLGAVGQLILVGSVRASVDIPYCDCGFKDQEIVSQVWAEMVVQGGAALLTDAATLLAACGVVVAVLLLGGRGMARGWVALSYVLAALLVITVLVRYAGIAGDLNGWLTALVTGILVPVWAIWLGRDVPDRDEMVGTTDLIEQ
jgi:hypothetical protein